MFQSNLSMDNQALKQNHLIEDILIESSVNLRGSHLRGKKFLITTTSSSTSKEGEAFLVEIFNPKIAHRHLLWKALYKGIDPFEWLILHQQMNLYLELGRKDLTLKCLILMLIQSANTRKRLTSWKSRTKPLFRQFSDRYARRDSTFVVEGTTLLEFLHLVLDIPQKGLSTDHLYKVLKISLPKIRIPEKSYIGKGHNDKGSLSSGGFPPEIDDYIDEIPFDEDELLQSARKIYRFFRPGS